MTHPNVEYWTNRVKLNLGASVNAEKKIAAALNNPDETIPALEYARDRLEADRKLVMSLLEQIKSYEERIMLLS